MRALLLPISFGLIACSPYKPDLSSTPFLCGSGSPPCPNGFTCQQSGTQMVCVDPSGPDGGTVTADGSGCQDDSMIEPNDTIATAWPSPVASTQMMIKLAQLSICPAGDLDTYRVDIISEMQNFEAIVTFEGAPAAPLTVQILNSGGTPIAASMPLSGMDNAVHAVANNLPTGAFYAQVASATTPTGTNPDYKLTLSVTGP